MDRHDEEMKRAPEESDGGRLSRAKEKLSGAAGGIADRTRQAVETTKEKASHAAGELAERTREAAGVAKDKAARAVEIVRESETDTELKERVSSGTARSVHTAGDKVKGAAPAIGRGAEFTAGKLGSALHAIAGPLAAILGTIAGTVGGWWKEAAKEAPSLPAAEEEACRAHFVSVTVRPAGMDYEQARIGYALGYIAANNPEYAGRPFDEIESDLRRGFGARETGEYDALREFARFGYGRASGGPGPRP